MGIEILLETPNCLFLNFQYQFQRTKQQKPDKMSNLPKEMKALRYSKPEEYGIVTVPLPKLRPNDVLIKVKACGVCGTDLHIHEGEFIAKFPLIPGMYDQSVCVLLPKPCLQCFTNTIHTNPKISYQGKMCRVLYSIQATTPIS